MFHPADASNATNSAFTNAVAIMSLRFAAAAAVVLGLPPSTYATWLDVAGRLPVPLAPSEPPFHPEYVGYSTKTTIKQADVVLLGWPLDVGAMGASYMTPAVRRADLDIYAAVTDAGGPAMTWGMHATGLLELGDTAAAESFVNRRYVGEGYLECGGRPRVGGIEVNWSGIQGLSSLHTEAGGGRADETSAWCREQAAQGCARSTRGTAHATQSHSEVESPLLHVP